MTNIFTSQSISFISIQEVKDSTSYPAIASLSNNQIKILIVQAESMINDYLGYDVDLTDVEDDVINDFKMATLYVVEQIYLNGQIVKKQKGVIKSENTGDRSWSYDTTIKEIRGLPTIAISILVKYKQTFYRQVL